MFLLTIYPLTLIPRPAPQALTYFYSKKLPAGSLVSIPLRKSKTKGLVLDCQPAEKISIKRASFEFKGIDKIISAQRLIEPWQIKLAERLAEYYWTSPGLFLKMMLGNVSQSQIANRQSVNKRKQTLILVPEISQIEPTIKELGLKDYVILHSGLKKKEHEQNRLKIKTGQAKNIIGTRIAVFAPFYGLKKILILDESNLHHKSWDMHPRYRVHEVARKLSKLFGAEIIFETSVPSVETTYLAKKYGHLKINLPAREQSSRAQAQIIDMREELKQGNFSIFSRELQGELQETIKNKKKAILFINRRGAGTFVLCRDCGYVANCPRCDVPLVQHLLKNDKFEPKLICHHCGHSELPPSICPQCRGIKIRAFGTGTQKVEMELKKLFPQICVIRLDADIAPTLKEQKEIIQKFFEKKTEVLVGTQMLFNNRAIESRLSVEDPRKIKKLKIFNFSGQYNNIGLASMISADTLLHLPDFRSGERTFQTITKLKKLVSSKTKFIIQSYSPENPAIKYAASDNWQKFYQKELASRAELDYPPFSQIIKLSFSHREQNKALEEAKILAVKLKQQISNFKFPISNFQLLGPSPAFIPKQKSRYIWQILIKNKLPLIERNQLLRFVPSSWQIDVDPESTL